MAISVNLRADGISIVLCGQAGMGIQTVEAIFAGMPKVIG